MIKNKKGVTLVVLTIMIVVLIIIATITSNIGIDLIQKSKYYKAIYELKAMQAKVNELYEDNNNIEYGESIPASILDIANEAYNHVNSNNKWSVDIGEFSDYKYFSKSYIKDELDMEGIDLDFIINLKTRMVILLNGVEMEGVKYFSLCEVENETYNIEYNETNE